MTIAFDLFWSFRSPYSYLVTQRIVALERDYDVRCTVRIVLPIAVRQADFFAKIDPLWVGYLMRDVARCGDYLGVPIRWPVPDPVVMDLATRTYPADQPLIHRLCRLGHAAAERGRGLAFIDEVSRLIWNGETDNWDKGDHLAMATERAGLNLAELDAAIAADPAGYAAAIETNQAAQRAAGHYGVPLLAVNAEPFFGQDRFDQFKWRLEQMGLTKR